MRNRFDEGIRYIIQEILIFDDLFERRLHMDKVFEVHQTACVGCVLILSTDFQANSLRLKQRVPKSTQPGNPPSSMRKVNLVYWSLIILTLFLPCGVVLGSRRWVKLQRYRILGEWRMVSDHFLSLFRDLWVGGLVGELVSDGVTVE